MLLKCWNKTKSEIFHKAEKSSLPSLCCQVKSNVKICQWHNVWVYGQLLRWAEGPLRQHGTGRLEAACTQPLFNTYKRTELSSGDAFRVNHLQILTFLLSFNCTSKLMDATKTSCLICLSKSWRTGNFPFLSDFSLHVPAAYSCKIS